MATCSQWVWPSPSRLRHAIPPPTALPHPFPPSTATPPHSLHCPHTLSPVPATRCEHQLLPWRHQTMRNITHLSGAPHWSSPHLSLLTSPALTSPSSPVPPLASLPLPSWQGRCGRYALGLGQFLQSLSAVPDNHTINNHLLLWLGMEIRAGNQGGGAGSSIFTIMFI